MTKETRRVGNGPYRETEVTAPPSPRRRLLAILGSIAVLAGIVSAVRWSDRPRLRPPPPMSAGDRAAARAHATTMAGGDQVAVLVGAGEGARVVRLPGRLLRRGTDVVREPVVTAAPDAVALMPDGAWAIDSKGSFFDASSPSAVAACRRRPCIPQTVEGHGRVEAITANGTARLEDGAVALTRDWTVEPDQTPVIDLRDDAIPLRLHGNGDVSLRDCRAGSGAAASFVTTPLLRVPEPVELVSARGSNVFCVRGRRGDVRCAAATELGDHEGDGPCYRVAALGAGLNVRAARLAMSASELCAVDFGGEVSCLELPTQGWSPDEHRPLSLTRVLGLEAATDVALSEEVDCARLRSGDVQCWVYRFHHTKIARRDAAVPIRGFFEAARVVAYREYVCALQQGEVGCWDGPPPPRDERSADGAPRRLVASGVRELVASGVDLCVALENGSIRCWEGDPFRTPSLVMRGVPEGGLHALTSANNYLFGLDVDARAWWVNFIPEHYFTAVPALDGYDRLVLPATGRWGRGPLCFLRGGDLHCPTSDDGVGFNNSVYGEEWPGPRQLARTLAPPGALAQTLDPAEFRPGDAVDPVERELRQRLAGEGVYAQVMSTAAQRCLLGVRGHVACKWAESAASTGVVLAGHEQAALVPGVDDAVELAVTLEGLACARRATGAVVCWGYNAGGALTVDESANSRRLYGLSEWISPGAAP